MTTMPCIDSGYGYDYDVILWFFHEYTSLCCHVFAAPAEIIEGPTDRQVWRGTHIKLKCEVAGIPKPTIMWMKNEIPVSWEISILNQNDVWATLHYILLWFLLI